MRGFFLAAFLLVGLDVVLNAPGSRVAATLTTPTVWLAKWMDPHTPLISAPVPSSSGAAAAANSGTTRVGTMNVPGGGKIGAVTTTGPIPFIPIPWL